MSTLELYRTVASVTGRRAGIPLSERLCPLCMHGVGDEKHLMFEFFGIRLRILHLFTGFHTIFYAPSCTTRRHAFHH